MSYFVVIRNLKVKHANVLSSQYAVTASPLTAISLFCHAMGVKCGSKNTGVAIIHHSAQYLAENDRSVDFKNRLFQQRKSASYIDKNDYAGSSLSLSLQPIATAHLNISLLVEFESRPDLVAIEKFLKHGRISGGDIVNYGTVLVFDENDEDFFDAIPANGYWLIDRTDLMDENDPVQSLVSNLGNTEHSWLTPIIAGFALTSLPVKDFFGVRSLPNGDFPEHAFAEPLLGLAQYISIRQFSGENIPVWRPNWVSDSIFIINN